MGWWPHLLGAYSPVRHFDERLSGVEIFERFQGHFQIARPEVADIRHVPRKPRRASRLLRVQLEKQRDLLVVNFHADNVLGHLIGDVELLRSLLNGWV